MNPEKLRNLVTLVEEKGLEITHLAQKKGEENCYVVVARLADPHHPFVCWLWNAETNNFILGNYCASAVEARVYFLARMQGEIPGRVVSETGF